MKAERIRAQSPWGKSQSWRLLSFIVKVRDDLRQEQLACQMVRRFQRIWAAAKLPIYVFPYASGGPTSDRTARARANAAFRLDVAP